MDAPGILASSSLVHLPYGADIEARALATPNRVDRQPGVGINPTQTFAQYAQGRFTTVQYPKMGPSYPLATPLQLVDMYSYTAPGTPGGGLPSTKRLEVNQNLSWLDSQGYQHQSQAALNLDSAFTYNSEGAIGSITYPSTVQGGATTPGASYNYTFDGMERLSGMTSGSGTVVSGVSYDVASRLAGMTYNTIVENRAYNILGQLYTLGATQYSTTLENLTYNYPAGANNGKISSMVNGVTTETVTYAYDSLNRLHTAAGSGWNEQYTYDGFGNLTAKNGTPANVQFAVTTSTNQLGPTDPNGNATQTPAGYTITYDVENRVAYIGGISYNYDAQNRRIWSWNGALDSYGNPTGYALSVYTPGGQKLATYQITRYGQSTLASTLQTSDQYFGGRRLAVLDQLGSAGTYYPWGEAKGSTNPQDTWSYATYWRDSISGLDYANNRYYSNQYGRFMTPDPYQTSSTSPSDPANPQRWNRYAYVNGDPVNFGDPSGTNAISAPIVLGDCDGDPGFFGCGDDFQSWGGPCGSVYVMTYVDGVQMPSPCDFMPVFFAPQPKPAQPLLVPTSLTVLSVSDTRCNATNAAQGQTFGVQLSAEYQVLDQYGSPLMRAGIVPLENLVGTYSSTGVPLTWNGPVGTPNGYAAIGRNLATNSAGVFTDYPVGVCSGSAETDQFTQSIIFGYSNSSVSFNGIPNYVNYFTDYAGPNGTGYIYIQRKQYQFPLTPMRTLKQRPVLRIVLGLILSGAPVLAQTEMANEIKRLMDRPDRTTGQDTKTLFSAGDQAAVELRKLYDDDFLSQPHNLRSVLWILETAFGMPNWIEHAAAREPRASISLLQSMKATVSDTRFLRAIERLTEKLTRPLDLANDDNVAHVPADGGYWCIDPLAMAIIPLSSRKSAPDLPVGYLGDTPLRLSEYRGRPIVLNVWDDDSRPQAAAVTFGLQQKYQDSRLVVIGMWAGPQRRDLDAYLSRSGMESPDFPIVFGGKDRAHLFGLGPLPLIVLIDRNGRMAAFQSSDGTGLAPASCTLEQAIRALVAQPADTK